MTDHEYLQRNIERLPDGLRALVKLYLASSDAAILTEQEDLAAGEHLADLVAVQKSS